MFSPEILHAAQSLTDHCLKDELRLVFAESCTGGLIAAAMTALPGSSRVVDRGYVTYSNESKVTELAVASDLIAQYGAVSREVALAMAQGALARAGGHAHMSIAVTGVAGADGGAPGKPVGLVHIAVARLGSQQLQHEKHGFVGMNRDAVREQTVLAALLLAITC